jgi:hypothetical protein
MRTLKKSFAEKRHRASESAGALADKQAGDLGRIWDGPALDLR